MVLCVYVICLLIATDLHLKIQSENESQKGKQKKNHMGKKNLEKNLFAK